MLVVGRSSPRAAVPVTLTAETLPFQLTDVTPDQGGDSRWVTMTITGARFKPDALVKLVRPGLEEIEPVRYEVIDATRIIATFDFRGVDRALYDVKVINPDGAQAILPYRYLVERALPPDVTVGLGGPRVLPAGQSGLYGISLQSLTNVDTPYVYFQFGAPEIGDNARVYGLPFLTFNSNVRGTPDGVRADVPWASLDSETNTDGYMLASGYALDVTAGGYVGASFSVTTYPGLKALADRDFEGVKRALYDARPDLARAGAYDAGIQSLPAVLREVFLNPDEPVPDKCEIFFMPFRFNVMAAATPMTRAEFVARQTAEAEKLRVAVLADATANAALVNLAADRGAWVASYLGALEESGLLRPEDEAPPIRLDPKVISTMGVLASGVLVGPAGSTIQSPSSLAAFFEKVHEWYGDEPGQLAEIEFYELRESEECGEYEIPVPALPDYEDYDLGLSLDTYFQTFNVFSPYVGLTGVANQEQFGAVLGSDEIAPLDLQRLFDAAAADASLASLSGPQGYGPRQFVPFGEALPYTVRFENPPAASTSAAEVRVVHVLDETLNPRSFRLGDIRLGDINVRIPDGRASFQGDFDFSNSKGFVLRVSAGIDTTTRTASWVLQAIDPETGEVLQDATRGLLAPNNAQGAGAGFVSFTVQAAFGTRSGDAIDASARVILGNQAPFDTTVLTHTLDAAAPVTTLTATQIAAAGVDYDLRWSAVDEIAGSGVRHTTVYYAEDGGDWQIWLRQTTDTQAVFQGRALHRQRRQPRAPACGRTHAR